MDETLANAIEELPRDKALEAARFLAEAMGVAADEQGIRAVEALTAEPYENLEEIGQLARLLLLASAADPDLEGEVRTAIDGAGRKQFILGGAEIIILAGLAITALHIVVTKGISSEEEKIRIETKADGSSVTTIDRKRKFGISAKLVQVLTHYLPS